MSNEAPVAPSAPDAAPAAAPAATPVPADTSRAAYRQMAVEGRSLVPAPANDNAPAKPPTLSDEERVAKLSRLVEQDNRNRHEAERIRQEKAAVSTEREAWKAEQASLAALKDALARKDYRAAMKHAAGGTLPADEWLAMLQATADDEPVELTPAELASKAAREEIEKREAELEATRVAAEERKAQELQEKVNTSFAGYLEEVATAYSPEKYPALEKFVAITEDAVSARFKAGMAQGLALTPAELFAAWEAETVAKIDEFRPPPAAAPPWTPRFNLGNARDTGGAPPTEAPARQTLAEKTAYYRNLAIEATRKR